MTYILIAIIIEQNKEKSSKTVLKDPDLDIFIGLGIGSADVKSIYMQNGKNIDATLDALINKF